MPIYFPRGAQTDIPSSQTQGQLLKAQSQTGYVKHSIPRSIDERGKGQYYYPPMTGAGLPAIVNVAISPATINGINTTPGNGSVDLKTITFNTNSNSYEVSPAGTVSCVNWYLNSGTISSGTHVTVLPMGAFMLLLGADC